MNQIAALKIDIGKESFYKLLITVLEDALKPIVYDTSKDMIVQPVQQGLIGYFRSKIFGEQTPTVGPKLIDLKLELQNENEYEYRMTRLVLKNKGTFDISSRVVTINGEIQLNLGDKFLPRVKARKFDGEDKF